MVSIGAQIVGGIGGGANSAAVMAIVTSMDQADREQNIGFMEMAFGLGHLFGPMMGGMLYHFGDYKLPFFFFATNTLLALPCIQFVLQKSQLDTIDTGRESEKAKPNIMRLIGKPRFLFGLLSQLTLMMSIQYLAPNMSVHMQNYGYNGA